jgi:hypothetical protein
MVANPATLGIQTFEPVDKKEQKRAYDRIRNSTWYKHKRAMLNLKRKKK